MEHVELARLRSAGLTAKRDALRPSVPEGVPRAWWRRGIATPRLGREVLSRLGELNSSQSGRNRRPAADPDNRSLPRRCEHRVATMMMWTRFVVLGLLTAALGACLVLAWGALRPLWGYQDSPTAFYVAAGGFWLALAAGLAVALVRFVRRR